MSTKRRPCPGGCGHMTLPRYPVCQKCWELLPAHLRRPITATAGKPTNHPSRAAAERAALDYLERNR